MNNVKLEETKKITTISVIAIFVFCFVFALIKGAHTLNEDIVVINQEINSHIINFILSTVMCILFGYMSPTYGKRYQFCFLIGIIIVAGNFMYETAVPLLNTIDIVGAVYSLVGVLFSLIYLYYISNHGFEDKE